MPSRTVMRVRPSSATSASIVAAGLDCQPGTRTTVDAGVTWSGPAGVDRTWFLDAKEPHVVHAPGPRPARPCDDVPVVDLAQLTARGVQVLCRDGRVRESGDSGGSWIAAGAVPGALAMDSRFETGGTTAYVLRLADGCEGLQVVRVGRATAAPEVLGCVDVSGGTIEPGTVTLSINGSDGWVGVGERVFRSRDGLRSWTAA